MKTHVICLHHLEINKTSTFSGGGILHSVFPDGQQNITFHLLSNISDEYYIKSRFNSWLDLERIVCTVKSLQNLGCANIKLAVPYFLGARSDRKFDNGGNYYLKDVIAPIINSLKLKSVNVLDAHSYVLENVIDNFQHLDELQQYFYEFVKRETMFDEHSDVVISPDAGAVKRAMKFSNKSKLVTCAKDRDLITGKLTKTIIPELDSLHGKRLFIIDDICSKGGTFKNLAQKIKENVSDCEINLVVSHYEDTADVDSLFKSGIDKVFTTNSIKDVTYNNFYQYKIF